MRVLGLTRYSRMGASSRLRSYQYEAAWADAGVDVTWRPFLGDDYLVDLYERRRRSARRIVAAYLRRLQAMGQSARFDLVWLEKEALPWIPNPIDPGLLRRNTPCVVDYDDAVFHYYDQSRSGVVRRMLGDKIAHVMRRAALIVAGNPYLAQRAHDAGAKRIEIVPTVVDLRRYETIQRVPGEKFAVGWIGSPSTQSMIERLAPVLARALDENTDTLVTIGARFDKPLWARHDMRRWSESSEVDEIRQLDVGVMPLVDQPFERGKCGYKLIQYMACGLPVVASPVGVNVEIVQHGVNGFLASSDDEWIQAIATLKSDADLRARMGAAGRATVERKYCLQVTAPRLVELLRGVA